MRYAKWLVGALIVLGFAAYPASSQQIGKFVPIQAGYAANPSTISAPTNHLA